MGMGHRVPLPFSLIITSTPLCFKTPPNQKCFFAWLVPLPEGDGQGYVCSQSEAPRSFSSPLVNASSRNAGVRPRGLVTPNSPTTAHVTGSQNRVDRHELHDTTINGERGWRQVTR